MNITWIQFARDRLKTTICPEQLLVARFLRRNPGSSATMQWDERLAELALRVSPSPEASAEKARGVFGPALVTSIVRSVTADPGAIATSGAEWGREIPLVPGACTEEVTEIPDPSSFNVRPQGPSSSDEGFQGQGGDFGGGGSSSNW